LGLQETLPGVVSVSGITKVFDPQEDTEDGVKDDAEEESFFRKSALKIQAGLLSGGSQSDVDINNIIKTRTRSQSEKE
jgi:hypothetical protein